MDTIYNVGDTVYIEATVNEIYIDEKGIKFMCLFGSAYGDVCRPTVGPEILKRPLTESIKEDSSNAET